MIVAASVRADQIMATPHLRAYARNSIMSMISIMIASIFILLPQGTEILGVELIVFNIGCAIFLPAKRAITQIRNSNYTSLHVPVLAVCFYLLAAASGVSLIVRWGGGLYLTMAAYLMYVFLASYNAYLLLLPRDQAKT